MHLTKDLQMLPADNKNIWGIILAGGDGIRLKDFLIKEYKITKPKQFCNIIGKRSLYKHTYDRVSSLIPSDHIISVITENQFDYLKEEFEELNLDLIVSQPLNRDTGPAIILPILNLYYKNPDSIFAIFPSDHFIFEESAFLAHVADAMDFISYNEDIILLLGVKPYNYSSSYGHIIPGEKIHNSGVRSIYKVKVFLEKPEFAYRNDHKSLWNTMVIIGNCKSFISAIQKSLPDVFRWFQPFLREEVRKDICSSTLQLYRDIPKINFSKEILEKIVKYLNVMEVRNVFWSDWGEEDKILYTLRKMNELNGNKIFA